MKRENKREYKVDKWKTYIVTWSTIVYGTQKVRARDEEEASRKAMNSEDIDMSEGLDKADWSIDMINEEKQVENENKNKEKTKIKIKKKRK